MQETSILKSWEYLLKELIPGEKYYITVKNSDNKNIERVLPLNILLIISKNGIFSFDFIVYHKYKKIDIIG